MIAVIDYGAGNLRSVLNAFRFIGHEPTRIEDPISLDDASAIVLPGVGAFGNAMANLRRLGYVEALERAVRERGKPFLGICVGLQLVAEKSLEAGEHDGLGWIAGTVEKIAAPPGKDSVRVPHIGWNDVRFHRADPLLDTLGDEQDFYFVHSYRLVPDDPAVVLGSCDYGGEIVSIIGRDNIHAVQFHPEKSHKAGLRLLRNWCERVAGC